MIETEQFSFTFCSLTSIKECQGEHLREQE